MKLAIPEQPTTLTPKAREALCWLQGSLFYDCPLFPLDGSDWWLVRAAGPWRPVAFAGLARKRDGTGYLCRAGVLPEARGSGLQRRLIDLRLRQAAKLKLSSVVTDTASWNVHSMNNLIDAGFRAFTPAEPWGVKGAVHWRKELA